MNPIKFCPDCGHATTQAVPEGDNRPRAICTKCGTIHYQNPKVVAGTLPIWQDKVLLCRRAIEPRAGFWTLPAGFMENEESVPEGAWRETYEEANAEVTNLQLYTVFSVARISQIYMLFRADLPAADAFSPGIESLETALFSEDKIPWEDLAFPMMTRTLEHYFSERKTGNFTLHVEDMG